jgi:hypothetical protein
MAVLNDGQVFVGIVDEPCTAESVLENIKPEFQPLFKAGKVVLFGQPMELCWSDGENFLEVEPLLKGHILIFDAIGNYGPIPRESFKTGAEKEIEGKTQSM